MWKRVVKQSISAGRTSRLLSTSHKEMTFIQATAPPNEKKKAFVGAVLVAVGAAAVQFGTSLREVPITKRIQVVALPMEFEQGLGEECFNELVQEKKDKIISDNRDFIICESVLQRLITVAEHLFQVDFQWKLVVIDEPETANACCFPGGKIVVYTGILREIEKAIEQGFCTGRHNCLAVILSHEIAHAIARHTGETLSFLPVQLLIKMFGFQSPLLSDCLEYLTEIGLSLPFSRKHEREADHIGLMLLAASCYDPKEAARFWKALSEMDESQPLEFLSTHPAHSSRMTTLQQLTPEAMQFKTDSSWCTSVEKTFQRILKKRATYISEANHQEETDFMQSQLENLADENR